MKKITRLVARHLRLKAAGNTRYADASHALDEAIALGAAQLAEIALPDGSRVIILDGLSGGGNRLGGFKFIDRYVVKPAPSNGRDVSPKRPNLRTARRAVPTTGEEAA
ncbi:MAG: hypothetical protein JO295_03640 [Verrucomicrobia bacterium]|nr:hypothetical protein [Verrucomicrobiota bacterium]